MTASSPVDDWRPPWSSFAEFFSAGEGDIPYLTELDREVGARVHWTRVQWRQLVAGTAAALAARGVGPGDTVAALAGNTADALAVAYACWTSGACYLPLNAHEARDRHAFILRDASTRLIVHASDGDARAAEVAEDTGVATVATARLRAEAEAGDDVGPPTPTSLDAPALRVYTSGTTGEPKGVELTAANLLVDCDALQQRLGWADDTRLLVVLPIHHVNGLVVSSLLSWYSGSSMVLCDRFRSERFWDDVESERATACSMVPSLLEFLLAEGRRPAPAHFREVLCGAGPLMCDTVVEFEKAFGVPVRHLYGLSETTAVATTMGTLPDKERRGWYQQHGFPSVGAALPHVEVQVHDGEGQSCPAAERGEIVVRGATVMTGYTGRAEDTAKAMRHGWFHTGDEGFWLADGKGMPYFFITGRIKELIIRGGVNVSPFQVDEVLRAHPAVRFGLAVPFENRFYGEEIAAYVVADGPVTEQEILDFCAARLDFALRPKVVLFGEDVPFTATGKAKRLSLKTQLEDRLAEFREVQFRRHQSDVGVGDRRTSDAEE